MRSTMNPAKRREIAALVAKRDELQRQLVGTGGHGSRAVILKQQADVHQQLLRIAFNGMSQREEYIAGAIRYHMNRHKGAVPTYASLAKLNIHYDEAAATFDKLHANGGIEFVKVPSKGKSNRMMTTLALTF